MTLVCVLWVDLPVAQLIHRNGLDRYLWMRWFLDTPIVVAPVAAIYMSIYIARHFGGQPGSQERIWFIISSAFLATLQIKNMLKLVFGRTWPREVIDPSLSASQCACIPQSRGFVNDGIHAFHIFGGDSKQFTAFPSGSTVALIAIVVPIISLYPRTRTPLALFSILSAAAFIITNTHFVSDVIAGVYVGAVCGYVTLAMAPKSDASAE